MRHVNSVNSVNSYSAVLPPSPMVFLCFVIQVLRCRSCPNAHLLKNQQLAPTSFGQVFHTQMFAQSFAFTVSGILVIFSDFKRWELVSKMFTTHQTSMGIQRTGTDFTRKKWASKSSQQVRRSSLPRFLWTVTWRSFCTAG